MAVPPVMYSQPCAPHPSTIAKLPEFLTANRSPACPDAYNFPDVAPYNIVLPIMIFSLAISSLFDEG